ncbi:deoxyribodipyrimidine photo-lyase [Roseomonas sp. NAR14]|uniref:Deoxyribodipyrimidine photo-lyase n=1 Tax=Roseomonas acroporae TaxID=2937791 RepID=A0A9X1Y5Y2_9PROT|nr:deoxyribodipyrimidine photo-lyase [Roseomonas acroporae]MCK8783670.1 deoxyribodipyrimidine photo-lyase [Roseomonas acroporae]
MIQSTRLRTLNDAPERAGAHHVLYWLGLAQRARFNPALEHAVDLANERGLPVLVCYGLAEEIPETNARHWQFLLEGLAEIGPALARRGIGFVACREPPVETAVRHAERAALVVCDRHYLKPVTAIQDAFAGRATCRVVQVEGEVVVPVETASPKHEYAARTLRPKLHRLLPEYLVPLRQRRVRHRMEAPPAAGTLDLSDVPALVAGLRTDHSVRPVRRFRGGTAAAERRLRRYLAGPFGGYAATRGRPEAGAASALSPYLHFGQISPVAVALAVRDAAAGDDADRAAFLEELVVRRELAINHVRYEPRYDRYDSLPDWARRTLAEQRGDPRPHLYTPEQFEWGETHDRHWNAAMREMRETGYMHNHMRMYWGKKILEWSASPEEAWETALRLNNRYFLDGRDANSFANVGWLFGLHDRPWGRRPVYGTVRSLGPASLRKFDAEGYVAAVDRLVAAERG